MHRTGLLRFTTLIPLLLVSAQAQVSGLTNASVIGAFFFRQLEITVDPTSSAITDCRSALGTITFDGAGHYSLNAEQTINTSAATTLTGQGVYTVGASGTIAIGNPQQNSLMINGRIGIEAIVGSTTESSENIFDLFIAIPAASATQAPNLFTGTYFTSSLEFPQGVATSARSAFFSLVPEGGLFADIGGLGHALNINSGQVSSIDLTGASYAFNGDGTLSADLGSVNSFVSGLKQVFISQSGNIILGGSTVPGSQDFLVGVRGYSGTAALANWSGLFYTGGLRYDARNPTSAGYVGSLNAVPSLAVAATYQREHQISSTPGAFDDTGYTNVALNADGTYSDGPLLALGLGPSDTSFVAADVLSQSDPGGFSIDFGIAADALAGSGVYINPYGILNGASFSPVGESIAPGEFISLFGSGLAAAKTVATPPYPALLGGVTVTVNGILAPIYLVSPTQLNILVPYSVTGATATIVAKNNGVASNSVTVPLAATAPGVFTLNSSGAGPGSILHSSNNTVVSSTNPAKPGEAVSIYLTGLGAVSPSVSDGSAGLSDPLSKVTETVVVYIGNLSANVSYAGLAPGSPGLYQINVTVPAALTGSGAIGFFIQTAEAFAEQATIAIQ
jgi:uncharacterized protein (TIGR03437 family)